MQHSFDVEIAKEYGLKEAILMNHLWFWIEKNKANEIHYYDGTYWTYNSVKAFNKLFPYLSESQINNTLKELKDKGIIQTGNYNKSSYDRTMWYAFTKMGISIMQKCKMDNVKISNGYVENVKTIPDINTDIITNINTDNILSCEVSKAEENNDKVKIETYKEIIDYLNNRTKSNYKYTSKATQVKINARLNEGYSLNDFIVVIDKKCAEWLNTDFEQYLCPETLFGTKFEKYLNQKTKSKLILKPNWIETDILEDKASNEEIKALEERLSRK